MPSIRLSTRDRSLANLAAFVAVATIAQQVAGKATRDALFLSEFPASELPKVMGVSALLAVAVAFGVAWLLSRFAPARVVPLLFLANGGLYGLEWALAGASPHVAGAVVYIHSASAGAAAVSTFWSIINESFDPHAAKAAIGRIAAGATAGGIAGGVGAWQLSQLAGVRSLLVGLALTNVVVAIGLILVASRSGGHVRDPARQPEKSAPIRALMGRPYLRVLASVVALSALAGTVIDYVFKAQAAAAYDDGVALAAFFSLFHAIVGVVTFSTQILIVKRTLSRFGLAASAASLPGVVATAGLVALAAPVLVVLTALRGAALAIENSLFRSAYELTYTPIPPADKRATKTIIDVGSDKLASAASSGLILLVVMLLPAAANRVLIAVAIGASFLFLALVRPLHRGYVRVLADGLRSGAIEIDEDDERIDRTTRQTVADTMSLSRSKLLEEIAVRKASHAPTKTEQRRDRAVRDTASGEPLTEPEAVDALIDLLVDADNLDATVARLRSAPDLTAAPLLERLAKTSTSPVIRRRIPRVLRAFSTPEVVSGLLDALSDPVFEVRYRAAVAMLSVTAQPSEITVDPERIFDLASAELDSQIRDRPVLSDVDLEEGSPFDDENAEVVGRRLTYVFTLLALVVDREPLHLSFCALASSNKQLRGTGLEYLDSVLPRPLRRRLTPYLTVHDIATVVSRPRQQIVDELLESKDSLAIDRTRLMALIKGTD